MEKHIIEYFGEYIEVDEQISDYFEEERKRQQAEERKDRRHLSNKLIEEYDFEKHMFYPPTDLVDEVVTRLVVERLKQAINSLSEKQQRRLKLYFFEELTYEQIAILEEVNVSNIWRSIEYALKKLKEKF